MPKPPITPQVLDDAAVADGDALHELADPAKDLVPASSPNHPRYRPPQSRRPAETNLSHVARILSFVAHLDIRLSSDRARREKEKRVRNWSSHLINALHVEVAGPLTVDSMDMLVARASRLR